MKLNQLMGKQNAKIRQQIIYQITKEKLPLAKCGINNLKTIIIVNYDIDTNYCMAKIEDQIDIILTMLYQ